MNNSRGSRLSLAEIILMFVFFLPLSCSDDNTEITAPLPAGPRDGTLHVKQGGIGNGSPESPFGSIQRALETAFRNPEFRVINVAVGEYNGSPRVKSGVTINGGLDPANEWKVSTTGRTIIRGARLDSLVVGMMIRNLSRTVTLRNLTIIGDAATNSGGASIGLYCQNAGDVRLIGCVIEGGNGMGGSEGLSGINGQAGADAEKREPGLTPVAGGRGGAGGPRNIILQVPGFPGEDGSCFGSAGTGGKGGQVTADINGSPGENGQNGASGEAGSGGSAQLTAELIDPYVFLHTGNGGIGLVGEHGCAGGGGSGSWSIWNPNPTFSFDGLTGGGGGAGGAPGTGGSGGVGGGSSVGILAYQSTISLDNCEVISASGGNGGNGRLGGSGGIGGMGSEVPFVFVKGGIGGNGGVGGAGGVGGGGSGGWSVGIALFEATLDTSAVTFVHGQPGSGGIGDGSQVSFGEAGLSLDIHIIQ